MPFDPNSLLQDLETRTDLLEDWSGAAAPEFAPVTKYVAVAGIQPTIELQDFHIDLSDAFDRHAHPVQVNVRGGMGLRDDHDMEKHGPFPYQECLVEFSSPVIQKTAIGEITSALAAQCARRDILFDDYSLKMDPSYRP